MLMRYTHPELQFTHALPYGAVIHDHGVQFVVFSRSATALRLLLYKTIDDTEPVDVLHLDPQTDRWGDIWSVFVPGVQAGQLYHFQADGPYDPENGQRFDAQARLIDPYAKALAGRFQPGSDGVIRPPKCVVVEDYFDWEGDRHLRRELSETVIYEMHVRGFTKSASSGVQHPGTYLGMIEKIPYLQSLGVTAVELMPIHEFPIRHVSGHETKRPNYWGYDPLAFFSPHRGYAASDEPGAQVREFKQLVKSLHQAGIEVILDVVFNHTCEGNERGPVLSFKGLENRVYYMLDTDRRRYRNYSGCGNTINGNHPIVREMIFNCLRHWVHNYHVDGFRFDLASILSRNQSGELVPNAPIVNAIAEDPLLADTKIIAEAWDAAGAYQVGSFGVDERWAEWNGRYRDEVRSFWRGDVDTLGAFATRLAGSSDLYERTGRAPHCSINFITSHDGFTLNDLVSYREKQNAENEEDNRDGENHNLSDGYGAEGPTRKKAIESLRARQIRNMMTTLLLSQGVPMLLSGDECRRTQKGNNNAYCQDNATSWFDWNLVDRHADLWRFCQSLIHFRCRQPTVRRQQFLTGRVSQPGGLPDVSWYAADGGPVDWAGPSALICLLTRPTMDEQSTANACELLFLLNSTSDLQDFVLPAVARSFRWRMFVDTAAKPPGDIFPAGDGPPLDSKHCHSLVYRSSRVYVAQH